MKIFLIIFLLLGKFLQSQEERCELVKLLHHYNNKLMLLNNGKGQVDLTKEKMFDLNLIDSSTTIRWIKKSFLFKKVNGDEIHLNTLKPGFYIIHNNDTTDLSEIKNPFININQKDDFLTTKKIGENIFLNLLFKQSKIERIEILESDRTISLAYSYFDSTPQITSFKIEWNNANEFIILTYSYGQNPFLLNYYDDSLKGGIGLFFKFRRNYFNSSLVYKLAEGRSANNVELASNQNDLFKIIETTLYLKYNKNGILRQKSSKELICK